MVNTINRGDVGSLSKASELCKSLSALEKICARVQEEAHRNTGGIHKFLAAYRGEHGFRVIRPVALAKLCAAIRFDVYWSPAAHQHVYERVALHHKSGGNTMITWILVYIHACIFI